MGEQNTEARRRLEKAANALNCHHERSEGSAVGMFTQTGDSSRQRPALVTTVSK